MFDDRVMNGQEAEGCPQIERCAIQGDHMNTLNDVRSILRLIGGCLFCFGLAAIGFYPFAGRGKGSDHVVAAYARKGVKALIS
jgi:hypothetical protein